MNKEADCNCNCHESQNEENYNFLHSSLQKFQCFAYQKQIYCQGKEEEFSLIQLLCREDPHYSLQKYLTMLHP